MRIDIMTLFPDTISAVLHESIIGRAAAKGIVEINCVQIRDYTDNKQNQVDDYPYGGGWGCVLMAQPLKACLDSIKEQTQGLRRRVIYMSPQGKTFTQETAKRLKNDYDHLVLVCGHYEGIDERFIESCVDEEISLGDFVLTGGELAAAAITDSVCRLVPGVLSDEQCYTGESHWDGLLEYPQYTRPAVWEGMAVPEILIQGDHEKVERWRRMQQIERTMRKRPDMFEKLNLSDEEDLKLLEKVKKDASKIKLTAPVEFRNAAQADLESILAIIEYAKKTLKKQKVDQWQGTYPSEEDILKDIGNGECIAAEYLGEIAAFFVLSEREEPVLEAITDGKWSKDVSYCVIHRMAVAQKYRGSGISRECFKFCEKLCAERGIKSVRTDTHKNNKAMLAVLKDMGYRYRGNVMYFENGKDAPRRAFEKIIKVKK